MFIAVQLFQTTLTGFLSNVAVSMPISAAAASQLNTALGSGNYTICTLSNGVNNEIIHITGASGTSATIVRAQEGTTASAFSAGSTVRFVFTTVGIQQTASGGTAGIAITGSGATTVTGGPFAFGVASPAATIAAGAGVSVTGAWPNFTITNTSPGTTGITTVTGSGLASASTITGGFNVDVPAPSFVSGTGIAVSGTWPNITITNTAPASGGTGTVTSVAAGTGITITGTPTIAPVMSISPTGISAGTYGPFTVNAQGQITAYSGGAITGIASGTAALTITGPTLGIATLSIAASSTSASGLIQTALPTLVASTNPADTTSAVTPAGVAAAIGSVAPSGSLSIGGNGSFVSLSSGSYTNIVGTSSVSLSLASGKSALVRAVVDVLDTVTPANMPSFAMGFFNGATFLTGNNQVQSGSRTLSYVIAGPFTGVVTLATTALTGTFAIQSWFIDVTHQ